MNNPDFEGLLDWIHYFLEDGSNVLIHCSAGVNRSPTVVIAYLIKYRGQSVETALEFVKSKRPCIMPTRYYISQLIDFENRHRDRAHIVDDVRKVAMNIMWPDYITRDRNVASNGLELLFNLPWSVSIKVDRDLAYFMAENSISYSCINGVSFRLLEFLKGRLTFVGQENDFVGRKWKTSEIIMKMSTEFLDFFDDDGNIVIFLPATDLSDISNFPVGKNLWKCFVEE